MIYAVYRCLYGEDFIQESIRSIDPYVDKIFVFWDDTPWGDTTGVMYKGQWVDFPKKFDNILDKIGELKNSKVELIYDHQYNNLNQFTYFVNDLILPNYAKPKTIMVIEVDHVFRKDQIEQSLVAMASHQHSTTKQIELWKTLKYRIPARGRPGTIFWNMENLNQLPMTGRQGNAKDRITLPTSVHNLGFCISPKVMYWKHLTAMAFSKKIGDSPPEESWYENKWLKWHPKTNNENLEIAATKSHLIPHAEPYDENQLPEILKK